MPIHTTITIDTEGKEVSRTQRRYSGPVYYYHNNRNTLDNCSLRTTTEVQNHVKNINILTLCIFIFLCIYVVYGAYEFTYNYKITNDKDDIIMISKLIFSSLNCTLFLSIISLQLYKHKYIVDGKGCCYNIMFTLLVLFTLLYMGLIIAFLVIISKNNILFNQPIDTIVFSFLLLIVFALICIVSVFLLISFTIGYIYNIFIEDKLISPTNPT
jgi:hypothetical protein